jgi:mannose-6-phosphate isomerase-like protein (cupin superfamily)
MDLIAATRDLLDELRQPLLAPFLAEWPAGVTQRRPPQPPVSLPVLRWLNDGAAPTFCRRLVTTLADAAPAMAWKQTYTAAQTGQAFLDNYGWCEIIGTTGEVPSERLACGFLLLGPNTFYPQHHHEAEEIYVPLVGTATWEKGHDSPQEQPPGTVIHHPRHMTHAMRTGDEALLALYLWRSDSLGQKAQLSS